MKLKILGGTEHIVLTGITILDAETGETASDVVETKVEMRLLANDEIKAYVATGEPTRKAGGEQSRKPALSKSGRFTDASTLL
jgi:septum formation protein